MKPEDLVIGKFYVYSRKLSKEIDGVTQSWTEVNRIKFIGDLKKDYPELGITHCSHYLFIGAEMHPEERVGVFASAYIFPEFQIRDSVFDLGFDTLGS